MQHLLKTIRHEFKKRKTDNKRKVPFELNEYEKEVVENVRTKGYHVIEDFWSQEKCADVRKEVDRLIEVYKDKIWVDEENSDHRVYGADRVSPIIKEFYDDEFIQKILMSLAKSKNMFGYILAAHLMYKEANLGSGGGWHRDNPLDDRFKAIIYVSDVEDDNGPFQYIEGSFSSNNIIKKVITGDFRFGQNRFDDETINKVIKKAPQKMKSFTAKAGTLIFVNTRGLHRGAPIKDGERYALTSYVWFDREMSEHIAKMMITNK